jgi:hypothetical protein
MSTSTTYIATPTVVHQTLDKPWNVAVKSLRGHTHNTGVTMHTPQDGMQALDALYKSHNAPVKRLGHTLALQQRVVAITKLDLVSLAVLLIHALYSPPPR